MINDNELIEEVKRLYNEEKISRKILLAQDEKGHPLFLEFPENENLRNAFNASSFKEQKHRWHHVVRLALDTESERVHMYDKILELIRKHTRISQEKYFQLETAKNEQIEIPPLTDFNKLEILSEKYWKIYYDIKNKINFDNLKKIQTGTIRGKINWSETIRKSGSNFPIEFVTSIAERRFVTVENLLLIICAKWLHSESSRILRISFKTKLSRYQRNILEDIHKKSEIILSNFPFKEVVKESRIFWDLEFNHSKIKKLENETKRRIKQKNIRNQNYEKLLEWIDDFKKLNIQRISGETSTKNILKSLKDVDTMYEVWIFLEFVDYLYEKDGVELIDCELGKFPKCRFKVSGIMITFWYEKSFSVGDKKTDSWAVPHRPDYPAMIDDEVIAVFDAKNYAKTSPTGDVQNKMLAYMNNLNVNFGALIFPEHPKHWDDYSEDEKAVELKKIGIEEKGIRKKQKKLSWDDTEFKFRKNFPNSAFTKEEYPKNKSASIIEKKVLALCRMRPGNNDEDVKSKKITKESLDFIFRSIVERIPLRA